MTYAEELTKLETLYSAWLDAGCPQSYSIHGKMLTKTSFDSIVKRIDEIRSIVARQTSGNFYAGQFRDPE